MPIIIVGLKDKHQRAVSYIIFHVVGYRWCIHPCCGGTSWVLPFSLFIFDAHLLPTHDTAVYHPTKVGGELTTGLKFYSSTKLC
jgi:F0F1-type ATP synthase assembly protein I